MVMDHNGECRIGVKLQSVLRWVKLKIKKLHKDRCDLRGNFVRLHHLPSPLGWRCSANPRATPGGFFGDARGVRGWHRRSSRTQLCKRAQNDARTCNACKLGLEGSCPNGFGRGTNPAARRIGSRRTRMRRPSGASPRRSGENGDEKAPRLHTRASLQGKLMEAATRCANWSRTCGRSSHTSFRRRRRLGQVGWIEQAVTSTLPVHPASDRRSGSNNTFQVRREDT